MEEALLRILTPRRSIDILRDVHSAKEQGRPYVVVFCGVNGVGKSTNLAKVYLFKQKSYLTAPILVVVCHNTPNFLT
jgi:signal recognition particle receptor subunit alpha